MAPTWSAEHREGQDAPSGPATLGAPTRKNAPPAEPIRGWLAFSIPRAATILYMGLTWILASRNEVLQGAQGLLFTFLGSDADGRSQATYLVSNMISPVLIWTIEANRDDKSMVEEVLQQCTGVAVQFCGIERVAPIYYVFTMANWDSVHSAEGHIMSPEKAKAVLPATLLGYVLPAALFSLVPMTASGVSRSYFNIESSIILAFFAAPMSVPALTTWMSNVKYMRRKTDLGGRRDKAMPKDTSSNQGRDSMDTLHSLRLAYAVSFGIQAAQHLYTIARKVIQTPRGQRSVAAAVGSLLTRPAVSVHMYSSIALYSAATLGFGLYTVWELRRRGMVSDRDAKRSAIGVLTGQVLFGPGATYAGLWWWREGVLARMRQRA